MSSRSALALLFASMLGAQDPAPASPPANERIEAWPDGSVKARFTVDEAERRHGKYEQFATNGVRVLLATYVHGERDGDWREWNSAGQKLRIAACSKDQWNGRYEEWAPDGSVLCSGDYRAGQKNGKWFENDAAGPRRRIVEYRAGLRHGPLRILLKDKVVGKQTWKDGELVQLDELQPFPTPRERLRQELQAILSLPTAADAKDPLAPPRLAALHRLQAYRHLCGLPWQELTLVPEWNLRCDAGAEICRRIGHLEHKPTQPAGMDDARFRLGYEGTSHSNLAIASSLAESVDGYMDDSDPGNIDRIGHRRWCLNPAMAKTGFGTDGRFHAMWSMDESGGAPKAIAAVFYPPRGYVPVDLFEARRAFSITILRGSVPKANALAVTIQPLDAEYLPEGGPLEIDWCSVAGGDYGHAPCLVFRGKGIVVEPGRKYLVDVSTDAGKTVAWHYLVEFCAAAAASGVGEPSK